MLKDIYEEKKRINSETLKDRALKLDPNLNISILDNRSAIVYKEDISTIYKSIEDLMINKMIDPNRIINIMPLFNNNYVINI